MTKMAILLIHFSNRSSTLVMHMDATLPQFLSVWLGKLCAQACA